MKSYKLANMKMELKDNAPIIEDSDTEESDYLEDNAEQLNSPENRTRFFARDWFEDLYEDPESSNTDDQFASNDDLLQDLYSIAQTDRSHYLPTDVTQAFLDELLKFVTLRSRNPEDHDQLSAFIANIQERLFSISPCLINHLPLPEQMLTTAKFSRQPETQGWMGSTMVGEQVYELSFCSNETVEYVAERLARAPLSEQLDVIHQFQAIGANAVADGDWAIRAYDRSREILSTIKESVSLPIIDFAVDAALKRLEQEEQNPTLGVIKSQGDRSDSRLVETNQRELDEHKHLRNALIPDIPSHMLAGGRLQVIARDAVGVFDHSGLPRSIGSVDVHTLTESVPVSPLDTQNIQEAINWPDAMKYLDRIVIALRDRVVLQQQPDKKDDSSETIGQAFHSFAPQLSVEEWDEIFNTKSPRFDNRTEGIWDKLAGKFPEFTESVHQFITSIELENKDKLPTVRFERFEDLVSNKRVFPFSVDNEEDTTLLLQHLHHPAIREQIEESIGFSLRELPLRSQVHLLRYLAGEDSDKFERLRNILQFDKESAQVTAEAFFAVAEGSKSGDDILDITEYLQKESPEKAKKLFATYARLVALASQKASQIYAELSDKQPEVEISEQWIYQSLLARANALITESHLKLQDQRLDVDEMLQDLEKESAFQEVLRAQFLRIANLLSQDDVDLSKYRHEQELIASSMGESGENESVYLRALNAMGRSRPLPELYWKVDRNSAEYDQRLGVDMVGLMKGFAEGTDGPKTVLEFGPGSGIAKHERSQKGIRDQYEEYAMSDALYYDIASLIGKLIDFNKLESKIGRQITPEEQKSFIEYIKATILIESGQTGSDSIVYDETVSAEIQKDPNRLKSILLTAGERMNMAEVVPTDQAEETPEGPRYREKFRVSEQTVEWQKARELLIEDITDYLSDSFYEVDAYELLDAHPTGIILGDFGQIDKLQDEQIDLALGVRSTVYVERENYAQFISEVYQKLKTGGIYIDDNVRENFGRYYRIEELKKAQEMINDLSGQDGKPADFAIYLVLGPGVAGEDYRKENSPLAIVVSKAMPDHSLIEANLMPNCRLVKLDDIASDTEYLKSLGPDISVANQDDQKKAA